MTPNVPFKTQLGHDELRSRALKLGQRHRTILVLVDGHRPLAQVLSLAQQAGAATQHFEDLLRLGLVELPPEPVAPITAPTLPPIDDALTSIEIVVPEDEDAVVTVRAPLVTEVIAEAAHDDEDEEGDTVANPRAADDEEAIPPPAAPPKQMPVLSQAVHLPPPTAFAVRPEAASPSDDDALDIALPLPDAGEARLLSDVRALLTDTLRLDAPLFSARTFMRVRSAQSRGELIDLLWEIQDHFDHKRRTQRERDSLQRARELLGLGNTLVSDDSRPDYLDS